MGRGWSAVAETEVSAPGPTPAARLPSGRKPSLARSGRCCGRPRSTPGWPGCSPPWRSSGSSSRSSRRGTRSSPRGTCGTCRSRLGRRDHGDRDGPDHRDPQHRPVGRRGDGGGGDGDGRCDTTGSRAGLGSIVRSRGSSCVLGLVLAPLSGPSRGDHRLRRCPFVHGGPRRVPGWRGAAWWIASGQTIAPMDTLFRRLGGGAEGTIGGTWSWIVGVLACVGIVAMQAIRRRQRAE